MFFMVLSKMKRKLFPLLVGGVFCVVVMSLYRMLEMMQGAELQHLEAPAGQVNDESTQLSDSCPSQ